ncbi:MAG: hypothetical protein EXQ70_07470 [Solirubrobacterales bacterium]|nr:hypothetical protein [Solirubrobacterales bacterium]
MRSPHRPASPRPSRSASGSRPTTGSSSRPAGAAGRGLRSRSSSISSGRRQPAGGGPGHRSSPSPSQGLPMSRGSSGWASTSPTTSPRGRPRSRSTPMPSATCSARSASTRGPSSPTSPPGTGRRGAPSSAEQRRASAAGTSGLPTGRESYRVYEDYTTEMKQLAESHPGLVRPVVIGTTYEGRPIEGIEIASQVDRRDDGRPAYLQMGLHHAREWPSGEFPMEFAHQLVNGYVGGSPRITSLLDSVRVFVLPVINVDGFIASRSFGTSPADDDEVATFPLSSNDQAA